MPTASKQLSVINYYRKRMTLIKCVCLNLNDMAVSTFNVIINKDIDDLLFILLENNKSMKLLCFEPDAIGLSCYLLP